MAEDKEEKETEKSSGGLLPVIHLVLLVMVLAVGGFNAWTLMNLPQQTGSGETAALEQTEQTEIPQAEDESGGPPVIMQIEDITVNLADTDQNRFLRTKIKLELRSEEAQSKVAEKIDPIRDLILTFLRGKKFSDIRTPEGTYALKEQLITRMNRLVGGKPIRNLYFTDFVSQ